MTQYHTTNYGITYADDLEPLANYPAITQAVAQTIDAALGHGGVAPYDATSLAAEAAARQSADTTLGNRVTAVEATTPVTLTLASGVTTHSATWQGLRVWKQGQTAFMTGLIKGLAVGAGTSSGVFATVPAGLRPAAAGVLLPTLANGQSAYVNVATDGGLTLTNVSSVALPTTGWCAINGMWRAEQ